MIFLDFETASCADLPVVGAYAYAKDPSTKPILLSYRLSESGETRLWTEGHPLPKDLMHAIEFKRTKVAAWNIQFDRWIWNNSVFGEVCKLGIPQCYDVMSQAAVMGLPLSLAKCGDAIGLTEETAKSRRGSLLIKRFCCAPFASRYGDEWDEFKAYCVQDTNVLVTMHQRLDKLTGGELRNLHTDMYVNERGLPIDYPKVLEGLDRAAALNKEAGDRFAVITEGLKPTQVKAIVQWINDIGYTCTSLAKAPLQEMLEDPDLPSTVYEVLTIRRDTAKSSVAKLAKMRDCSVAGRVMGCHQHHAATTGRAGGRLVQTQNLPRPHIQQTAIDQHFAENFENATMADISSCLRGMVSSDRLVCSDWSNIEGRVLPWLAGEQWKLDAFMDFDEGKGEDIYKIAASKLYHWEASEIDPAGRQIGKVVELACGFAGGLGAFSNMASIYGVEVSDDDAQSAISEWRAAHPRVTDLWARLGNRAKLCVQYNMAMEVNDKLSFRMGGEHLYLRLPNGRELCYPYAKIESVDSNWGKQKAVTFMGKNTYTQQWGRCSTHGGKLAENVTQATARDILYEAMHKLIIRGHVPVMHVHDEVVIESSRLSLDDLNAMLCEPPEWANGLPLAAAGWEGARYRK